MKITLLIIITFFISSVQAYEISPFPVAEITKEQWLAYYEEVSSEEGIEKREYPEEELIIFVDPVKKASIAFTMKKHKAHPSWVTRYVSETGGTISINQIGYFAGKEKHFAKLFQAYAAMVKETQNKFEIK